MTAALAGALELLLDVVGECEVKYDARVTSAKAILAEYYAAGPVEPVTLTRDALSSELSALAAKIQRAEEEN